MANRVTTLFDGDSKGLKGSLKSVMADIRGAEGLTGKFKAGVKGMGDALKNNAGPAALAAGGALVAFGIKAVAAFENTAKAAIDMGAAVGMGTENASRWIAVGDDMGVTADQLTSAFGKVAKTLDSGKWEQYGVATRDAGGHARSTNDIILDTFDSLSKITNETERAKAGNDLFGKGYANLAPMIGKTRAEMEAYLGSVEDGQVITDEEAKKAEKMRLAQDKLSDALNEVTLAAGSFVANLSPLISALADVVTWTVSAQDAQEAWARDLVGIGDDVAMGLGKMNKASADTAFAFEGLSKGARDDADAMADARAALDDARIAAEDLDSAVSTLKGHIDDRQAWRNMEDAMAALTAKIADGTATWGELADAADTAVLATANVIDKIKEIPDQAKTSLIVALDQGNLDAVNHALEVFKRGIDVPFYPKVVGGGKYATGGRPDVGSAAIVGDGGRTEVFAPDKPGRVYPSVGAAQRAGVLGDTATPVTNHFTFNVVGSIDEDAARRIAEGIDRWNRGNS